MLMTLPALYTGRTWEVFKIARITRLFRVVPACIKVQEHNAREKARVLIERKRLQYGSLGSPVDKVLQILQRLRRNEELDEPDDKYNIQ